MQYKIYKALNGSDIRKGARLIERHYGVKPHLAAITAHLYWSGYKSIDEIIDTLIRNDYGNCFTGELQC